jgi:hypothetical protein
MLFSGGDAQGRSIKFVSHRVSRLPDTYLKFLFPEPELVSFHTN